MFTSITRDVLGVKLSYVILMVTQKCEKTGNKKAVPKQKVHIFIICIVEFVYEYLLTKKYNYERFRKMVRRFSNACACR